MSIFSSRFASTSSAADGVGREGGASAWGAGELATVGVALCAGGGVAHAINPRTPTVTIRVVGTRGSLVDPSSAATRRPAVADGSVVRALPSPAAVLIAAFVAVALACGSIRQDQLECEEAVTKLTQCCSFDPSPIQCVYSDG